MNVSIHLDEFEAIYGVSDNINELRNKILDLAFKGKLTKQKNSIDYSKNNLNKKRKNMMKEKGLRKPRKPRGKEIEKKPFNVPENWTWIKLIDAIGTTTPPKKLKQKEIIEEGNIPVVSQSQDLVVGYTDDLDAKMTANLPLIVFGDHTTEVKYIDFDFAVGSDGVKLLKPLFMKEKLFYYYLLYIDVKQKGYRRHFSDLKTKLIPLIPELEQKRIVEKIEELMSQVDELEDKVKTKEETSENLSYAVADAINNSQNGIDLKENLQLLIDNMDKIFNTPDSMEEMRNVVLQLAIEGKLVDQDPSDEPANSLMLKIEARRKKLIKKGEIRNSLTNLDNIDENKMPFKLPKKWKWVRLGKISKYIQRGKSPKYVNKSNIPVISQKCIQWSGFEMDKARFIDEKTLDKYTEERFLIDDDLLWNSTGVGTIGRINVFKNEFSDYEKNVVDSHVTIIRLFKNYIDPEFIKFYIMSPTIQNKISFMSTGTTKQTELNLSVIINVLIPLPPKSEQERIVKKVKSITNVIDKLENKLNKKNNLIKKLGVV